MFYYGEISIPVEKSRIVSLVVVGSTDNHMAIPIILLHDVIRVYTPKAEATVSIRVTYI